MSFREIRSSIQCTASIVDGKTANKFYIGTNTGNVADCLQVSIKCSPQVYITNSGMLLNMIWFKYDDIKKDKYIWKSHFIKLVENEW